MSVGELTFLRDDETPIKALLMGEISFTVGQDGITRIKVYREEGQSGWVPWLAVYGQGEQVLRRVNAAHVHIIEYE